MAMNCPACGKAEMIQHQVNDSVSIAGIFGAMLFIGGLLLLMVSTTLGAVAIVVAIAISVIGRPKHTELICPLCKHTIDL